MKRLTRREFLWRSAAVLGAAPVLAGAVTGCGPTGAPATQAPGGAGGAKREVTIWVAFPELHTLLQNLGPKYTEKNPNITVTSTLFPQRAQEEKVASALPAGEAADLIELDKFELYPYWLNGYLEPLSAEAVDFVKAGYPEVYVESASDKEQMFTFPWLPGPKVMFYNKDYFEEAGLDPEKGPETIEEQMGYAVKLTKRNASGVIERAGLDLRLSGGGAGISQKYWTQVLIPYGARLVAPAGEGKWKPGYAGDPGYNSLQYFLDAIYKHKVETVDFKSDAEAFGLGLTAMFQRESWVCSYLRDNAPNIRYGTFTMPKGPGGWGTVGNTIGLSVSKSSKLKQEVFDFALWLMNEENTVTTYLDSGWQPGRTKGVDYSRAYEALPQLEPFFKLYETPGHQVVDYENMPAISELHNRFAEALVPAFKSEAAANNPDEVKKIVDGQVDQTIEILKRHNLYGG